jgi:putative nucleotidyltransferase with HDIG domain
MSSLWGDVPEWFYAAAEALMRTLKAADSETYYHCMRVGELSRKLARDAGLNEYEQKVAHFSGMFHDIGKVAIDKAIINKPGKLDSQEKKLVEDHPVFSVEIISPFSYHTLVKNILPGVRNHHERYDGNGYPDRLIGDQIPLMARLVMVVDTYDAMSQDRSYRKGLPDDIIYAEFKRCMGTQFDEQFIKIFLQAHKHWHLEDHDPHVVHFITKKIA